MGREERRSQACVSQTCSSAAIHLKPPLPPPPEPASNKVTLLQTKEETTEAGKEKKQDRKSEEEMENKLFTLTANAPQRVVRRKRGASRRPRCEALQTGCLSAGAGGV